MPVTDEEAQRRADTMAAALRAAGLRLTHQRLEVLHEVARSEAHPDVEIIYQAVRLRVPTISLDTVYRTLATLADLRLITRVAALPGPTRYDANLAHHHHFVCTSCGLIRDVVDERLDAVPVPQSAAALGAVAVIEVQFRGICSDCTKKQQADQRTAWDDPIARHIAAGSSSRPWHSDQPHDKEDGDEG